MFIFWLMMIELVIIFKVLSKYVVCSILCNLKELELLVLFYGNIIFVYCLVCVDIFEEVGIFNNIVYI